MDISKELRDDIIMFLEQQEKMYEMTMKSKECNFIQRKGVKMLQDRLQKVLIELKKED